MAQLSLELREFVDRETWTYAKTMPKWPHEYLVRERVEEALFVQLVEHIRKYGYEGSFYRRKITYYDEGDLTYWTMGAPIEETVIINRCKKENTYEVRLAKGTLSEQPTKCETIVSFWGRIRVLDLSPAYIGFVGLFALRQSLISPRYKNYCTGQSTIRLRPSGRDWEVKLEPPVNKVLPVSRSALSDLWKAFA